MGGNIDDGVRYYLVRFLLQARYAYLFQAAPEIAGRVRILLRSEEVRKSCTVQPRMTTTDLKWPAVDKLRFMVRKVKGFIRERPHQHLSLTGLA